MIVRYLDPEGIIEPLKKRDVAGFQPIVLRPCFETFRVSAFEKNPYAHLIFILGIT